MKILLTVHQFFPDFKAGTEVLTLSVARELIKRGNSVRILTGYPSLAGLADHQRLDEYCLEDGLHVYRFNHAYEPMGEQSSLIEINYNNQLSAIYFEHILEEFSPDIVHFFHLERLGTALIERSVRAGVPCFMTSTDFWSICPMGQMLLSNNALCPGPSYNAGNCLKHFAESTQGNVISKIGASLPVVVADSLVWMTAKEFLPSYPKRAEVKALSNRLPTVVSRMNMLSGIVVPNKFLKQSLVKYGINSDLINVCAFGIDFPRSGLRRTRSLDTRSLRVGFIGTLAPHKGCDILVNAFLKFSEPDASLKIYGSPFDFPDYFEMLRLLARDDSRIQFCGTFPNSEIGEVFEGLDVLVVPSIWYENNPLVVYSANFSGCPVIASNLPGLSEVVRDGVDGLLFDSGSSESLAEIFSRLVHQDGLLERLSEATLPPKSISIYVDELEAIWG